MKLFNKVHEDVRLKLIAILSLTGLIFFNALATLLSVNNNESEKLSDKYPNLLAPSESILVIWIFIFLGLWGYVIYQFSTMRGQESLISELTLTRINIYFIINTVLSVLWTFAWAFEAIWLTVPLIIGILYTLIRITGYIASDNLALRDKLFIGAPFSLYFGWVTYATVANIMTWLVSMNWDGFGLRLTVWAAVMLILTSVFTITMMYRRVDWIYGAAVVWAFMGILLNHLSPNGWDGTYPSIIVALTIIVTVLLVATLYVAEKEYHQKV